MEFQLFQVLKEDVVKVLHSIYQQIWITQRWPQDWIGSVFIPIAKKGNAKEFSNYGTIARLSHTSKIMFKILHARLLQYMNCEFPDVQAGFRKSMGTRDQISDIQWIIEKAKEFQQNIYFCFIDYVKAFDCVYHNKLWKTLTLLGIPDHLTCLLRNLYAGQEATVRTRHGTIDWSKLGKEYVKTVYCHPAYLTYMENRSCKILGWKKHKLESRLPGINNLKYADDTTLMAESEEELKSLFFVFPFFFPFIFISWKLITLRYCSGFCHTCKEPLDESERGEWKTWLKLNIKTTRIMTSGPITSLQIDEETMEVVTEFIFLCSKITVDGGCSHEIRRHLLLGRKAMTHLDSI